MKPEAHDEPRDTRDSLGLARAALTTREPYGQARSFKLVHNRFAAFIELEPRKEQQAA